MNGNASDRHNRIRQIVIDILAGREAVVIEPTQFAELKRGVAEVLLRKDGAASLVLTAAGFPELRPEDGELLREVFHELHREGLFLRDNDVAVGHIGPHPLGPFYRLYPE